MAPRYKHSFHSLSTLILEHPTGEPYAEYLGHHSEGLLEYDGTAWSLYPRLIDEEKYNAAFTEAMAQQQNWSPERAEQFRTILGPPHCRHTDPHQFIALLHQIPNKTLYFTD